MNSRISYKIDENIIINNYFDTVSQNIPSKSSYIKMLHKYDYKFEKYKKYITPFYLGFGSKTLGFTGNLTDKMIIDSLGLFNVVSGKALCNYFHENNVNQKNFFLFGIDYLELSCLDEVNKMKLPLFLFLNDVKNSSIYNINNNNENLQKQIIAVNHYNKLLRECKSNNLIMKIIKEEHFNHNNFLIKLNLYNSELSLPKNQRTSDWKPDGQVMPYEKYFNNFIKYKKDKIKAIINKWKEKVETVFEKRNLRDMCKIIDRTKTGGKKTKRKKTRKNIKKLKKTMKNKN